MSVLITFISGLFTLHHHHSSLSSIFLLLTMSVKQFYYSLSNSAMQSNRVELHVVRPPQLVNSVLRLN